VGQPVEQCKLGIFITDGGDVALLKGLADALVEEKATFELIAPKVGGLTASDGTLIEAHPMIDGGPSVLFDAVAVLTSTAAIDDIVNEAAPRDFVADALGAAGLAIGLALQGTLQNIAAGIMLLVLRPFRVGEYIETSSVKGKIVDVGRTGDGLYLMAPNSTLWNTPIINHSREPERRQELSIAIGNDTDVSVVKETILAIVASDKRVKTDPPPRVVSDDLTADKTALKIEYWASTGEWTETRYDMIDKLKGGLAQKGIAIK
jgi:small conductance mechanosensitive channel